MATTWNPSDKAAAITLSGSDQIATGGPGGNAGVRSVANFTTAKVYCEFEVGSLSSFVVAPGIVAGTWNTASGSAAFGIPTDGVGKYATASYIDYNGTQYDNPNVPAFFSSGNRCAIAFDGANARVAFNIYTGGSWSGWRGSGGTADPTTGANMVDVSATLGSAVVKYLGLVIGDGDNCTLKSATADWTGTCPTGYSEIGITEVSVAETASAVDAPNATANSLSQLWQPNAFGWFPQATSSGNTYNDSAAEAGSATDTSSAALIVAASLAETGNAADTLAAALVAIAAVAESGAASDTGSGALSVSGSVAETGSAADTPSASQAVPGAISETGSASDTPSAGLVAGAASAETASAADTVSTALVATAAAAETGSASDTPAATLTRVGTVAETASAADTPDGVVLGNTYNDSVAETASAADTTTVALGRLGAVAETGSAADTVSVAQVAVAVSIEAGSAADTSSASGTFGASVAEAATAVDTPNFIPSQTYNETVAEAGAANDNVDATGGQSANVGLPFGMGAGGRAYSRKRLEEILSELRAEDAQKAKAEEKRQRKQAKAAKDAKKTIGAGVTAALPVGEEQEWTAVNEATAWKPEAKEPAADTTALEARVGRLEGALIEALGLIQQQSARIEELEDDIDILMAALMLERAA